jgi:hypothetical protein
MDDHLKQWIQRDAAKLAAASSVTPEEYVAASGLECTTGHDTARQLGGVQVRVNELLFSLKQAGLYKEPQDD